MKGDETIFCLSTNLFGSCELAKGIAQIFLNTIISIKIKWEDKKLEDSLLPCDAILLSARFYSFASYEWDILNVWRCLRPPDVIVDRRSGDRSWWFPTWKFKLYLAQNVNEMDFVRENLRVTVRELAQVRFHRAWSSEEAGILNLIGCLRCSIRNKWTAEMYEHPCLNNTKRNLFVEDYNGRWKLNFIQQC